MTQHALLTDFNAALATQELNPIAAEAFGMVLQARGEKQIRNLVSQASKGSAEAVATLKIVAQKVRLAFRLRALHLNVTYDEASAVLAAVAQRDLVDAINSTVSGDANARKVLTDWVNAAKRGAPRGLEKSQPVPPASPEPLPPPPERPTPPPMRPMSMGPSRPMSAPPNHPTGQARVASHVGPPRAAARSGDAPPPRPTAESSPHPSDRGGAVAAAGAGEREYENAVAYGRQAALTFSADITKRKETPTVRVEAALAKQGREYDWQNKLTLQLTGEELQLVAGLFGGHVQELHFSNHGYGDANDKWMNILRQDNVAGYEGTIKFTLGQGKADKFKPRTVLVDFNSYGPIYALLLRQCKRYLRLDEPATLETLKKVTHSYAAQKAGKAAAANGGQQRNSGPAQAQRQQQQQRYA